MSYITRARFLAPNPVPRNTTQKPNDNLPKTVQEDKTAYAKKGHEAKDGWFGVVFMEYSVEVVGQRRGRYRNGRHQQDDLRLLKQIGALSPICMQALHDRALFNLRVECIDRAGQGDKDNAGKVRYIIEFKTLRSSSRSVR